MELNMGVRFNWWVFGLAAVPYAAVSLVKSPQKRVDFAHDIAPLFKAHCLTCHAGKEAAGGLDLSTAKGIQKGGPTPKFIDTKHPEQSQLLRRLQGLDGKDSMPMGFAPLAKDQISLVRRWISEGAIISSAAQTRHWAYISPKKAALPPGLATNPIDRFVLDKLKKVGLTPSPTATKEQLLRRVSLDLIGLPPSVSEIDSFLADTKPDAYERVVDRLLASPQYGERQARLWLDLARYADSDGYEKDLRRTAWKYRDWVINAFNQNMPYDRFTVEQIAGDLMPQPTQDQLIATGFHRNTMMNLEGGVDQEEAHFNVVIDRVGTTATVWLGSTLACARCHDHKYDPFAQRDFYKMAAFFGNAKIYPQGPKSVGEEKWYEKQLSVPTLEQSRAISNLESRRAELIKYYDSASVRASFNQWRSEVGRPIEWNVFGPRDLETESGASLKLQSDQSILVTGINPAKDRYTLRGKTSLRKVQSIRIEALTDPSLGSNGPGRAENGNFVLTGVELNVNGTNAVLVTGVADFVQGGYSVSRSLFGNNMNAWAIVPNVGKPHQLVLSAQSAVEIPPNATITISVHCNSEWAQHNLGRFRISLTDSPTALSDVMPEAIKKQLGDANSKAVKAYFQSIAPELRGTREQIEKIDEEISQLRKAIPTALVMEDKPTSGPLIANIRTRGEFLQKAEAVTANTPAFLPPMPKDSPGNRLGLAKWLVSRNNPLTARVQVNRMWELLFGRGLVETSEDFGTQGSRPSHPELLDWLAVDLMDKGWDLKAMYRLMVTSSTYKQASATNAALLQRDPQNVFLARGPRFRLEAEAIRDTVLRAAGLLDLAVGGPSVMPYQPDGVWDTPYNGERWMQTPGTGSLRRGIYTFLKRTSPYPSFMAFDAGSRESCIVRRIRTNTPLQALAMMNDESVMIAARGLARRMLDRKSSTERVRLGFMACTGRKPTAAETYRLEALANKLSQQYRDKPDAAKKLGGDAQFAAWTMVANVLLNLDETVTKS